MKNILFIEDEDLFLLLAEETFSMLLPNSCITFVSSFEEAIKAIEEKIFDAVITDNNFFESKNNKKMNAFGNQIAQKAKEKGIRTVIACTGYPEKMEKNLFSMIGLKDYFAVANFLKAVA